MIITILILTILNFLMLMFLYVIFGYFVAKKLKKNNKVSTFSPSKNLNHVNKKNQSRKSQD